MIRIGRIARGPKFKRLAKGPADWRALLRRRSRRLRPQREEELPLAQEQPGFHLCIDPDIETVSRHAAQLVRQQYRAWLGGVGSTRDTPFRSRHFTIAVGGGNTVKNQYRALLRHHFDDINWLDNVRFFVLEESAGEQEWESAGESLVANFILRLAAKLIIEKGRSEVAVRVGLGRHASVEEVEARIVEQMVYPIDPGAVAEQLGSGSRPQALRAAGREAQRYRALLTELLGPAMSFHMIISGIGKDGGLGALAPYTAELQHKKPSVLVLEKPNGAVGVALSRGVLTGADCVSLIISGSLKLRALGRFEMEDSADFEQTVMETPIRILRETHDIARKVYIFADDRALLFEEGAFRYEENGQTVQVKSEVRDGDEPNGIHILLVHGFMGLYTYINLLIRLPSAWRVSALRRGKYAKTLPDQEVFPHYADAVKRILLHNWRTHRPTPIVCHSMAGIISDHLLLSMLRDYGDELPAFERLKSRDRQLIEALRVAGVIHIATWAPSDSLHQKYNAENLKAHRKNNTKLDFSGPGVIYRTNGKGTLELAAEQVEGMRATPPVIEKILKFPGTETVINGINLVVRQLVGRVDLSKLAKQGEAPYGQRLLGNRVLRKVSFYGVLKEVNAAMHDPHEYQARHQKALEAILKYDIPYLVIIHRDDFLVSANRHSQEHEYLLQARLKKEGVSEQRDLRVPVELLLLERTEAKLPLDLINPHFLILSTTKEGGGHDRKVTAAITRFVHDNVARAIAEGRTPPLDSVAKWQETNT